MYKVFEALDELVTILEEARGVPMTSSCVVPRGDLLELLDEVRDALPGEVDDAQDVLDSKDEIVGKAEHEAEQTISKANLEAGKAVEDARAEAERLVAEARAHADRLVADAEDTAERTVAAGQAKFDELVGRSQDEADRMIQAGRESYERQVEDGRLEQARLVSQTDVVQAAHAESARILDATADEAARQRGECDEYVDSKLAEFGDLLTHTLRTVDKGRAHLRGAAPGRAERCRAVRLPRLTYAGRAGARSRAREIINRWEASSSSCPNTAGAHGCSTPGSSGRRPGLSRQVHRVVHARDALGVEGVIAVPKDAEVELDVLLESVVEGVLVTGTACAEVAGECSRCLDPIAGETVEVEFTELFAYPDSATEQTTDEDEIARLVDDLVDLEPVVRDATVLALPSVPAVHAGLCRTVPGLRSQVGRSRSGSPA